MPKSKIALQEPIETEEEWTNLLDKEVKEKKIVKKNSVKLKIVSFSIVY